MKGENAVLCSFLKTRVTFGRLQISDVLTLQEKVPNKQAAAYSGVFKGTIRNTQSVLKNICVPENLTTVCTLLTGLYSYESPFNPSIDIRDYSKKKKITNFFIVRSLMSIIVQQDATIYSFIIFLQTALHVSDDILIHHQEHTQTVITASGTGRTVFATVC